MSRTVFAFFVAVSLSASTAYAQGSLDAVVSGNWEIIQSDFNDLVTPLEPDGEFELSFDATVEGEGEPIDGLPPGASGREWDPIVSPSTLFFLLAAVGQDLPGNSIDAVAITDDVSPSLGVIDFSPTDRVLSMQFSAEMASSEERARGGESIDLVFSISFIGSPEAIAIDPIPTLTDFSQISDASLQVRTPDFASVADGTIEFASIVPAPGVATLAFAGGLAFRRRRATGTR